MWSSIKLFVCDWDETLTKSDTISLLAECGYESSRDNSSFEIVGGQPCLPPWKFFVDSYLHDLEEYKVHEKGNTRVVVTEQIQHYIENLPDWVQVSDNLKERIEYLAYVDKVERASLERIQGHRLFENVTIKEIEEKAKDEYQNGILRPGAVQVLSHLIDKNVPVAILSVNWSRLFIRMCLSQYKLPVDKIEIIANEFVCLDNNSLEQQHHHHPLAPILTGLDKAMALQSLQKRYNINPKHPTPYSSIYVGDSNTDLLCLLAAERGAIIVESENSASLLSTCSDLHIPVFDDTCNQGHISKLSSWNNLLCALQS